VDLDFRAATGDPCDEASLAAAPLTTSTFGGRGLATVGLSDFDVTDLDLADEGLADEGFEEDGLEADNLERLMGANDLPLPARATATLGARALPASPFPLAGFPLDAFPDGVFPNDDFASGFVVEPPVPFPDFAAAFAGRTAVFEVGATRCAEVDFFEDIRGRGDGKITQDGGRFWSYCGNRGSPEPI